MSRNVESHFGNIPTMNVKRSKFKRPCSHKLTANTGQIIPIYRDEVLPGDTVKMKLASLIRMTTPIDPVMDNAWADIYFFAIPRRLVWNHWREFMGENSSDPWTQETQYQVPITTAPKNGWNKNSIAHYMGARMNTEDIFIDSCYLRAYALTVNEWFRNENLSEPLAISMGDATTAGSNGNDYVNDVECDGACYQAVKYADYFTRGLPSPQKGPDVYLPMPVGLTVPVVGNGKTLGLTNGLDETGMQYATAYGFYGGGGTRIGEELPTADSNTNVPSSYHNTGIGVTEDPDTSGLIAKFENIDAGATISELRMAYGIQRLFELDARGGTRYTELIRAHFNVTSPDARQQRPEYLGGKRIPINMTEVTASTAATGQPLGDTAGKSLTIDNDDMFIWSATEHSIILGLLVIRTEHTYQQGIDKILTRRNRFDFYWPALASISEQAIKEREIFAQGTADDDDVFGYQEAWAEYRYSTNRVSGELNSDYNTPLDSWHYGDDYAQAPVLSDEWVKETDVNVKRTLAIQDQDQFICDFYFDQTWTRPMPIYSIPGLMGWY